MIEAVYKTKLPEPEKKGCQSCRHCQAAVSWWCVNKTAVKAHGTAIPEVIECSFWEPARLYNKKEKYGDYILIT